MQRPSSAASLALLLGTVMLSGPAAHAQTVSLNRGGETVKIEVGDAAKFPPGFPEDVFVPPSARLQRVETPAGGRVLLEFADGSTPQSLDAAYARAMAASGWTRARVRPVEGAHVQAWEQDARAVLVAITAESGTTRLRLQLLPRASAPPAH